MRVAQRNSRDPGIEDVYSMESGETSVDDETDENG